jgi:hypothetical protein
LIGAIPSTESPEIKMQNLKVLLEEDPKKVIMFN